MRVCYAVQYVSNIRDNRGILRRQMIQEKIDIVLIEHPSSQGDSAAVHCVLKRNIMGYLYTRDVVPFLFRLALKQ